MAKVSIPDFHQLARDHLDLAEPIRKNVAAVITTQMIDADVRSSNQGLNKKGIKGTRPQAKKAKKVPNAAL